MFIERTIKLPKNKDFFLFGPRQTGKSRTERGAEVDCIIVTPAKKTIAIEIKATANPSSVMLRGLKSFKEKAADAQLILACRVERPQVIKDVTVLPWQEALELICREA